ncbi:MAG: 2-keto-4-pentenoate hydratase [Coprobacillaceae bacterium]
MNKEQLYSLLSDKLYESQKRHKAIPPISSTHNIDVIDAYQIQLNNIERNVLEGRKISGKKIGLTSLPMQEMFNVNEPDYGHIFSDVDFTNKTVDSRLFLQPKVEGEIAFILKEDLVGPNITVEQVLKKTEYVIAALEIVDSRIEDWKIKLVDTVADNASFGGYCLGNIKIDPNKTDIRNIKMDLYKNNTLINSGTGEAVLGNPAYCVAWLANKMGEFGITLQKGEVILSGALSAALVAEKGDTFKAEFAELGTVSCSFV